MQDAYDQACHYYDARYDVVFQLMFQVSEKRELGGKPPSLCRAVTNPATGAPA